MVEGIAVELINWSPKSLDLGVHYLININQAHIFSCDYFIPKSKDLGLQFLIQQYCRTSIYTSIKQSSHILNKGFYQLILPLNNFSIF